MSKLTPSSTFTFHNGLAMPKLGFGVYQSHGPTCISSCLHALQSGYRHIDSAQFYRNESQVGEAIAQSKIPRDQVFLTTKIMSPGDSVQSTHERVEDSVAKLCGSSGYVDLFLVHTASGGERSRKMMWLALEKAYKEKRAKSIGVSNWGISQIEEAKRYATVWPPHVNQIELHPFCQQREIVNYCNENGIVVQAYCPLVRNAKAHDKTLLSVADKHKKSTSQVLIRYALQKNWSPLPKSDTPSRIEGNADVFDFELDAGDMGRLDDLDRGPRGAIVQSVIN